MERICDFGGERLVLTVYDGRLCGCRWAGETECADCSGIIKHDDFSEEDISVMDEAENQLREYFVGRRRVFDIPLYQKGTEFQQKVWDEIMKVPYGATVTYGELAKRVGNLKGVRAVAQACGANHLVIVVPCHRIIATGGNTGGYTGGVEHKIRLLEIETF